MVVLVKVWSSNREIDLASPGGRNKFLCVQISRWHFVAKNVKIRTVQKFLTIWYATKYPWRRQQFACRLWDRMEFNQRQCKWRWCRLCCAYMQVTTASWGKVWLHSQGNSLSCTIIAALQCKTMQISMCPHHCFTQAIMPCGAWWLQKFTQTYYGHVSPVEPQSNSSFTTRVISGSFLAQIMTLSSPTLITKK